MVFLAKKFKDRDELESKISAKLGRHAEKNREKSCIIKGKESELKILHLGESSSVFGCRVEKI